MAKKQATINNDPWSYDGPITRSDGARPFNHNLWPMPGDYWWANQELDNHIDPRWHFFVIALADGRFSTSGCVYDIDDNEDAGGRPCVFDSRSQAVRVAVARMIRCARASRSWEGMWCRGLKGKDLARVINWARQVVARETGNPEPMPVQVKEPLPVRRKTGLPLFDFT